MNDIRKYFELTTYKSFILSVKRDALFQRLLKNSSYLLSANVISGGIGFVQAILVARFLGVKNYGILALVTTYISLVFQLVDFRIWETVIKYVSDFRAKGDRQRVFATINLCYLITVITGISAFCIAWFASPLAARILHNPEIKELSLIASFSLLFTTTDATSNAILRVFNKFKWITIQHIVKASVGLGLVALVIGFFKPYGIKGILVSYVLSSVIGMVIFSYFSFKTIKSNLWDVKKQSSINLLRNKYGEIGIFLLHTNMGALWGMVVRTFDIMILGHYRSAAEVGHYKMAKNFVQLIGRIHDPFYNSIFPEITRLWAKGNVKKFNRFLKKVTVLTSAVFIPIAAGIFLFCGLVIRWTVGLEFGPSATAVRIMVWGITIGCVFTWARPTVIAIGKPILGNISGMIGALIVLSLSFVLVPSYGYVASSSLAVLNYVLGHIVVIGGYLYHLQAMEAKI